MGPVRILYFIVMIRALLLSSFIGYVAAQSCAVPTLPSLNGLCPSGTLIGTECCTQLATDCADKINPNTGVSDCPRMASYCQNSAYKTLMADQCKKTCNLCSGNGGTVCKDEINANTGVSDCPRMAAYCNNSAYKELMSKQCRKTCGLC